jgi:predicted dehydrogenase
LVRYLLGEVVRVYAMANPVPPSMHMDIESAVHIIMGFEDRTTAGLLVGVGDKLTEPHMELEVLTRRSRVVFSGPRLDLAIHQDGTVQTAQCTRDVRARQVELFLNAVQRRDASLLRTSYQDAVRTQAAVAACLQSLATGQPQKLRHGVML